MRVNAKRARDIKTRAREAKFFEKFFRSRGFELPAGGLSAQDAGDGPLRLAAVRENKGTYAFAQVRGLLNLIQ